MAKHGKTAPVVEKAPKAVKVPRKVADKMLADYSDGIYLSCMKAMEIIISESADEKK